MFTSGILDLDREHSAAIVISSAFDSAFTTASSESRTFLFRSIVRRLAAGTSPKSTSLGLARAKLWSRPQDGGRLFVLQ